MIFTPQEIKEANALFAAKKIFQYTPALYIQTPKRPVPVSSALLFKCREQHYLVTAGHTLKQFENQVLGILFERTFLSISGKPGFTHPNEIKNDKFDLGFFLLADDFLAQLPDSFNFFDLERFPADHEDTNGQTYVVVGHPLSRIKLNPREGKIKMYPFLFLTDINENKNLYQNAKFDHLTHQFVNYRPRRIFKLTGEISQGPKPRGLSGCAVWRLSDLLVPNPEHIDYFPTGVIIEHIEDYSVLVATRISLINEGLRFLYDAAVEPSKKLKINWRQRSKSP